MKKIFRSSVYALVSVAAPSAMFAADGKDPASRIEVRKEEKTYPVVIIGGGIGALTSSLYLARTGVETLVLEGATPGGLLTQSHSVQNWPGEMEIAGADLTEKVRKQAEANGAHFARAEVIGVDFSKRPFTLTVRSVDNPSDVKKIVAEVCIIAMGTQPNFLGIPGEYGSDGYWGRGVTNCAICDGNLYRDQVVGVVGGGDAAVLEALYLANIAKEVHVFVRKDSFRAFEEKRLETLLTKSNIKVHFNTELKEIQGDGQKVTHVVLKSPKKNGELMPLDGVFLAIGSKPNSSLFQGVLKLDEKGYILLEKDQQTSVEGVYAIGDIVDPIYKQAISAAGDGAKAALQAQQYLSDRENGLIVKAQARIAKAMPEAILAAGAIEIHSKEQFEKELKGDIPVVVDFYASWCGPCKRVSPMIESSANALSGKVKFLKVNVDKLYDISSTYNIRAMPTVLLLDSNGSELQRKVGADQIAELLKQLHEQK